MTEFSRGITNTISLQDEGTFWRVLPVFPLAVSLLSKILRQLVMLLPDKY